MKRTPLQLFNKYKSKHIYIYLCKYEQFFCIKCDARFNIDDIGLCYEMLVDKEGS